MPAPPAPVCSGLTAIFFSELVADRQFAVALCHTCPYCADCYRRAMARDEHHGVWGAHAFGDQRSVPLAERVRGINRVVA